MSWTYKDNKIDDITQFPDNTYGFVYICKHIPSGKAYIGKKILQFTKKVKLGKKELAALAGIVGRRPSYKLSVKESDWKMIYQVLEKPDEFFNDNILGKFFTKDLEDIEFEDFVDNHK